MILFKSIGNLSFQQLYCCCDLFSFIMNMRREAKGIPRSVSTEVVL